MTPQKEYERSVRRIRESLYHKDKKGHAPLECETYLIDRIRPPTEISSKKYLLVLMLFSMTCESFAQSLIARDQIYKRAEALNSRPELQAEQERLISLWIAQSRNADNHKLVLIYRAKILIEILDGNDPETRY